MTDDEYDALSQKQLASIKRDMRVSFEDATVCATHNVMAELEQENNVTDRELMQQALNALEVMRPACFAETTLKKADTAITALRDRLAQPEQEPVVLMDAPLLLNGQPLYTTPPQRQWVGLTDEEVQYIADSEYEEAFVRLVEAKLKEKNT